MSYESNWTDAHRAHYFRISRTYGLSDIGARAVNLLYAATGREPVDPSRFASFNTEAPFAPGFMTRRQAQ